MYDYHLSDTFLTTWVLFRQTSSAMYKLAVAELQKVGLPPEKLDILWIARDHPGPLNPAEISRSLSRETQTVAGLLNALEKEGLLTRTRRQEGRPFTEVKITAKGRGVCGPGIETAKNFITRVMSSLSPEQHQQLQDMLRTLQEELCQQMQVQLRPPPGYQEGEAIPVQW